MWLNRNVTMHLRAGSRNIGPMLKNFSPVLIWLAAALILGVLGWTALLGALEQDREEREQESLQQAAVMSRAYAEQLARTLEATDQFILHAKYEWQLSGGRLRLDEIVQSGLFPSASLYFVAIADENGNLITSTIAGNEKINVSDRPYFLAHKENRRDFLYIGTPPAVHSANSNVIQFSRKLTSADGDFAGIVLASVSPTYLTQNYDDSALGSHGYLGILGLGNGIRVSRIGKEVHAPSAPALLQLPDFDEPSGRTFLNGAQWFADQRNRYVGWQAVRGYPLQALIGLDAENALAPHMANRAAAIRLATGATIALAIFTGIAMLLSMQIARRKRQLAALQSSYRRATEEAGEGFFIARPIYGSNGELKDFQVLDCNSNGAALFGWRRNDLLQKCLSSLGSPFEFQVTMEVMRKGMSVDTYEVDIEVPEGFAIEAKWLHFKSVRTEGNLAYTIRDISAAKAHLSELEKRSNEDELTGLPNRRWAKNHLSHAIGRARQTGEMLAVLYLDLDGFKAVNDTLGHAAGDELLCNAAQRLKLAVRPQDHVARLGGDEFMLILEHIGSAQAIVPVAERVLHAFREKFRLTQGAHTVGTSIGISVFPNDGVDAATLLRHADIAMYAVKAAGKASYRFFDQKLYDELRDRMEKEAELREAIEQDQFILHYQPRVDLATGKASSMESLVRWNHPSKGLVGPNEFIPLAEETGLILRLGEMVIHKVIAQLAIWARTGKELVPVSINVSPRQFEETDVKGIFSAALARYNIDGSLVEIEVTESSMMGDHEKVSVTLAEIQKMGIKLLVDDFGTGYSSLSQLQQLDFDVLKVDRAFTSKVDCSDQGSIFFNAIVTMAHALGMRVVAEGVENEKQVRILKSLRCDELQGFYISRPLPPTDTQPVLPRMFFPSAPDALLMG